MFGPADIKKDKKEGGAPQLPRSPFKATFQLVYSHLISQGTLSSEKSRF